MSEQASDASHEAHFGWWEEGDMSSTHHVVHGTASSIAALRAALREIERLRELTGVEEKLRRRAEWAEAEVERLSELLWGSRCVFCGEIVGKERKNQDIADEILREHVRRCPKHPLAQAEAKLAKVVEALEKRGLAYLAQDALASRKACEWHSRLGLSECDCAAMRILDGEEEP